MLIPENEQVNWDELELVDRQKALTLLEELDELKSNYDPKDAQCEDSTSDD